MEAKALEQKIRRLEFQNKRLSETVEVQKLELSNRQKTIAEQSKRWSEAQVAVLAVRRGWTQLHEDLKEIASRASLRIDAAPSSTPTAEGSDLYFDAVVEALLRSTQDAALKEETRRQTQAMQDLAEETDLEVKRMGKETREFLGQILERLPAERALTDEAAEEDGRKGRHRALMERVRMAEDKLGRRELELNDVRNLLTDAQIEVKNLQRKVLSYKESARVEQSQQKTKTEEPVAAVEKPTEEDVKKDTDDPETIKALHQTCIDSLVQSKTDELEKERTEHEKTRKELLAMEMKMKGEEWVSETRLYKAMMEHKNQLLGDVEKKKREIERLELTVQAKDREISKTQKFDPESRIRSLESVKEAQKKLSELQKQISKSERSERQMEDSAKEVLQGPTVKEFQTLVKKAQDETVQVKKRLKATVDDEERVQAARKETVDTAKRLRIAEGRLDHVKETVKELEDAKKRMTIREAQLQENKEDLSVFVDVLATCDVVDKQWKEAEAKARERNAVRENESLKRKIEELERVCGDEQAHKELETCRRRMNRLAGKVEQLQTELEAVTRTNKHNEEDLTQQKQLNAALEEELEQTGAAYEDTQAQSGRLLQQISERDATIIQLKQQSGKLTNRIGILTSQVDNLEETVKSHSFDSSELERIREEFQGRTNELTEEISTLKGDISRLQESLGDARAEVHRHESTNKELQIQLEATQKTSHERQRMVETEKERHRTERTKRQKLESDVKAFDDLKQKLRSGTLTTSDVSDADDIALLNREVESMRRCLNCSICGTRSKSVVLLKCMHTFCKTCIDNRIETRSRRCPGCGTAFSREEVRPFYLS